MVEVRYGGISPGCWADFLAVDLMRYGLNFLLIVIPESRSIIWSDFDPNTLILAPLFFLGPLQLWLMWRWWGFWYACQIWENYINGPLCFLIFTMFSPKDNRWISFLYFSYFRCFGKVIGIVQTVHANIAVKTMVELEVHFLYAAFVRKKSKFFIILIFLCL